MSDSDNAMTPPGLWVLIQDRFCDWHRVVSRGLDQLPLLGLETEGKQVVETMGNVGGSPAENKNLVPENGKLVTVSGTTEKI